MNKGELPAYWEAQLKEFECSRKNLTAWCREQGLSIHQAKYWQRKLRRNDPASGQSPQWLTFELGGSGRADIRRQGATLCIKIGPAIIEVEPGYNAELLKDVIRTLGTLC
jgi:hypothetical protein